MTQSLQVLHNVKLKVGMNAQGWLEVEEEGGGEKVGCMPECHVCEGGAESLPQYVHIVGDAQDAARLDNVHGRVLEGVCSGGQPFKARPGLKDVGPCVMGQGGLKGVEKDVHLIHPIPEDFRKYPEVPAGIAPSELPHQELDTGALVEVVKWHVNVSLKDVLRGGCPLGVIFILVRVTLHSQQSQQSE